MLERIFLSGAFVNFLLVILGSGLGLIFKKGIPERLKDILMQAMALCVIFIGVTGIIDEKAEILVIIISMAVGALLGELIDLDALVNRLALKIEKCISKGTGELKIADGFVAATLLFCVGAMTVVGSINSGILNDNTVLYSKGLIDCVAAIALTSSLGIGVMLSSVAVLFIEGVLTLLATFIQPVLTDVIISNMSVIGSLLIIAIALNMLKLTKIKVMNAVPAIFLPILLCRLF
ncbi:MAG: DUF554 domain-containing protein [Oscillospiraceae bacterium]|nr:DUF554 domain-containing protein [Oscillospiraceae bacterium]